MITNEVSLLNSLLKENNDDGKYAVRAAQFKAPTTLDAEYVKNLPKLPEMKLNLFGRKVTLVHVGDGEYYSQDVIDFEVNKRLILMQRHGKFGIIINDAIEKGVKLP